MSINYVLRVGWRIFPAGFPGAVGNKIGNTFRGFLLPAFLSRILYCSSCLNNTRIINIVTGNRQRFKNTYTTFFAGSGEKYKACQKKRVACCRKT